MKLPDIPTSVTDKEAQTLAKLASGKTVIEVGSLLGFSTIVMAREANCVYAIDPHEGYPDNDPRPTWPEFIGNVRRYNVHTRVVPLRRRVQECDLLWSNIAEMAFIDVSGHFYDTLEAILACDRWLKPPGVLAVHDYGLEAWPGAGMAIEAWARIKGRSFDIVDTMAVFS